MLDIQDPLHGFIKVSAEEEKILNHPHFQRLRFIKQLGFTELSFPGASHSRFIHSLGTCHLASKAFDNIFKDSNTAFKKQMRQVVRLASLLHDIGHGPLSHVAESAMPHLSKLSLSLFSDIFLEDRMATHEDFSIKFIVDSSLSKLINNNFDLKAKHIACLLNKNLDSNDSFFIYRGINYRPLLSQIISSELDVDRMDYLQRDSYYCGTKYGQIEFDWILRHLSYHEHKKTMYLSLDAKALYSFDDFVLSRHHMYLMVYCHHTSVIYEEMLKRFFIADKTNPFVLPFDIDEYGQCTDFWLYQMLSESKNSWAKRITNKQSFKKIQELHSAFLDKGQLKAQLLNTEQLLKNNNIKYIASNSKMKMSKYYSSEKTKNNYPLFVSSQDDQNFTAVPIEERTDIFKKYAQDRYISRIYVSPEDKSKAVKLLR